MNTARRLLRRLAVLYAVGLMAQCAAANAQPLVAFAPGANNELTLELATQKIYVLGADHVLLRTTLTNVSANHSKDIEWPRYGSERGHTGLIYTIEAPGQPDITVQSCRPDPPVLGREDVESLDPGKSWHEDIDLSNDPCLNANLNKAGHYSVFVHTNLPVCSPSASIFASCSTDDSAHEWGLLWLASKPVSFDVVQHFSYEFSEYSPPASEQHIQMPPSAGNLQGLLDSGNFRFAAWAAYFAARDRPAGADAGLTRWLKDALAAPGPEPGDLPGDSSRMSTTAPARSPYMLERLDAMRAVADALIQMNAVPKLSPAELHTLRSYDPSLALIFALLPKPDEDEIFDFFQQSGGLAAEHDRYDQLAGSLSWEVAGAALAHLHSRRFLDLLRTSWILHLNFRVENPRRPNEPWMHEDGGIMGFCDGTWQRDGHARESWPVIGNYGFWFGTPPPAALLAQDAMLGPEVLHSLHLARVVSNQYGGLLARREDCSNVSQDWVTAYGAHGERMSVDNRSGHIFRSASDDDLQRQLRAWMGEYAQVWAQLLAENHMPPTPLRIQVRSLDLRGGRTAALPMPAGFSVPGVTIASWTPQ